MKNKLFNNIGLKLLALASAIVIWIIVVSVNDPVADKVYRDLKVKVINENVVTSKGKTYQIENGTGNVSVTVRARRSVLSKLESKDIVATADLKEVTLSNLIPIRVQIPDYEGRYQKVTVNPLNAEVVIEDIVSTKYPISVVTNGTLMGGMSLARTEADPQTVTISGPKSVVSSIERVEAPVDLKKISKDTVVKSKLILYDSEGNKIDQSRLTNNVPDDGITVKVVVFPTKEVPIRIDQDKIKTPEGSYLDDVKYEPGKMAIAGEKPVLDKTDHITIPADAFKLKKTLGEEEVTLNLGNYLPNGIKLAEDQDSTLVVTFSIARLGEKVYRVPVGSVIVNNLSEDFEIQYENTDDLEVQVKGPQKTIENLNIDQAVSIDLQSYPKAGTYDVPVAVKLPEGCQAQPLTIKVTIKEK